ncbi:tetratricopeptide repeat protein [Chryseobacterium profundimaris]|uniref:Tetratricopeptide repeat protein n=1 Tax=Chryseobacterium profundimaris TaxID=1387275 RepID=A0ABY1PKJ2_9FLAO|nr:tetratricopeptide repeat protein [Chryseobacterium profundimaris]SMP35576.1 hypothetical protein SAMN06264346_12122 [Chryseobacterium profundimaris]
MNKIFLLLIFSSGCFFSQNYIDEGNRLLSENKFFEAEEVFQKGVKNEPDNLILKSQLALAFINQNKNDQAENIIVEILKVEPSFTAAYWYGGINNFSKNKPDFRKAIFYFEKSYDLIDEKSGQYFGVNFFIGKSYHNILYTEGLSYDEVSRMLETYRKYVELQPDAENADAIKSFILKVEKSRPGKNVKKWVIANSAQNADKIIKNELNEQ